MNRVLSKLHLHKMSHSEVFYPNDLVLYSCTVNDMSIKSFIVVVFEMHQQISFTNNSTHGMLPLRNINKMYGTTYT